MTDETTLDAAEHTLLDLSATILWPPEWRASLEAQLAAFRRLRADVRKLRAEAQAWRDEAFRVTVRKDREVLAQMTRREIAEVELDAAKAELAGLRAAVESIQREYEHAIEDYRG